MKHLLTLFLIIIVAVSTHAKEVLVFGTISTIKPELMEKRLQPLLTYLEQRTGKEVRFKTGRDYRDTIEKFIDGTFDLGYIGPSPYVLGSKKDPDALRILAGLTNSKGPFFHSVIITKKESSIRSIEGLKGKHFAFGSPDSTLSYYLPMHMLMKADIDTKLKRYDFLGRHDKVAQYVIMGKYDAGGIKESVAHKYEKYLDIIATSEPVHDFLFVANSSMDRDLFKKIQDTLLNCDETSILTSIKSTATGFDRRKDSDYDNLRKIMKAVDAR